MPTITVPARDIRKGDVLDLGGQPYTVESTDLHPDVPDVLYIHGPVHVRQCFTSTISVDPGTEFNVQRPDPDAELIEAIEIALDAVLDRAELINTADLAHAALAVAREHGAL